MIGTAVTGSLTRAPWHNVLPMPRCSPAGGVRPWSPIESETGERGALMTRFRIAVFDALARRKATAASVVVLLGVATALVTTQSQDRTADQRRRERLKPPPVGVPDEAPANGGGKTTDAPTGFDNQTNGMDPQGPDFATLNEDSVVPL